ncbi:MAG: glycosyltransferase [Rubrobacteraceae bacterium]|nr:glycosyltransferase [Rubrobacteraceae bacterium]
MPGVITVVTPVHAPSIPYLSEAYESLRSQVLPGAWSWEWAVQLDGLHPADVPKLDVLTTDPRVTVCTNRAGGPGVARTATLARTSGALVRALDADDRLLPGALKRDIETLCQDPSLGWVASKALDLLPDGTMTEWEFEDPADGRLPVGSVLAYWSSHGWLLPILPGTICIRRDLLLALGGWMALPTSEDTGMLMAANEISDGYFITDPSLAYRQHNGQVTGRADHLDPVEMQARRSLVVERAQVNRRLAANPVTFQWWRPKQRL